MGHFLTKKYHHQRHCSSSHSSIYLFLVVACLLLGFTNAASETSDTEHGWKNYVKNAFRKFWNGEKQTLSSNLTTVNDTDRNQSLNSTVLSPTPTTLWRLRTIFSLVLSFLSQLLIIFGGVIPYIPQYSIIKRTQNAEGFSNYVCLTLLVANILRIEFWFGKHFEIPLLLQSIVMILCMLIMLELWTRVHAKTLRLRVPNDAQCVTASKEQLTEEIVDMKFTDFKVDHFWRWTRFTSYIQFLLLLTTVLSILTWSLRNNHIYIETIGFMAVLCEALLGVPQFLRNFRLKSTEGMSVKMVLLWAAGDLFKTVYFVIRDAPKQFWLCGMLQISIDFAILLQVIIYANKTPHRPQLVLT